MPLYSTQNDYNFHGRFCRCGHYSITQNNIQVELYRTHYVLVIIAHTGKIV